MYTKSTNRHPTHALYETKAALIKFRQGDDMSNSDFLEKFKSLLDIFIHTGGDPSCASVRYGDFKLPTQDPDNNNDHYKLAAQCCCDEWVGVVLLLKSDPKRYSTLMADLINSYTCGQDVYPNNPTSVYDMLVNYHSPTSSTRAHVQDHGLAFTQDLDASGHGGRGGRGGRGGHGYTSRGGRGSGGGGSDTNATTTSSSINNNNNTNEQKPAPFMIVVQPNVSFKLPQSPIIGSLSTVAHQSTCLLMRNSFMILPQSRTPSTFIAMFELSLLTAMVYWGTIQNGCGSIHMALPTFCCLTMFRSITV
jgi:hypothetical protein